ncbi:MAG: hypothetical protein JST46_05425 [Bacteroidetes bacterium]|nr:hypothetical protein [Bacteroidota bacterium]
MNARGTLISTRKLLERLKASPPSAHVFTGFDGFIDYLGKPVRMRTRDGGVVYYDTIHDFAEHLIDLSGKSGQIEIITHTTKIGGNAPILAEALGTMGIPVHCVGSAGAGVPDPLFRKINKNITLHPVSAPGISRALEFSDGKVIFSELSGFAQYDWAKIVSQLGLQQLREIAGQSRVIALVDWANLTAATSIWKGWLEDVVQFLPESTDRDFLFDLCDPSRKSREDITAVLDLISKFSGKGRVTLGVNENELENLWRSFYGNAAAPPAKEMGQALFEKMNIESLLIHPVSRSILITRGYNVEMKGRVVSHPMLTTGGGDNFNAGYCLGLIAGVEPAKRLLLGMVASGAYVQNGRSPDLNDLISYTDQWIVEQEHLEGAALA